MSASTQLTHVRLDSIRAGVARLIDGPPHAILAVQGISLYLQGEDEQEGVLGAFARLLNTLDTSVQVVVRVMPVDLEPRLQRFLADVPSEYGEHAIGYADFLREQSRVRTLLDREYLVVVPSPIPSLSRSRVPFRDQTTALEAHEAAVRKDLTSRCEVLLSALAQCGGCVARRLADDELADLYYRCWQPDTARRTRIRMTLDDWAAYTVGRARPEGAFA